MATEEQVVDADGTACNFSNGSDDLPGLPLFVEEANRLSPNCTWVATSSRSQYIADSEWMLVKIAHCKFMCEPLLQGVVLVTRCFRCDESIL